MPEAAVYAIAAIAVSWFVMHAMCALYPRTGELPGMIDTDVRGFLREYRRDATFLMWLGLLAGAASFIWTPFMTVYLPVPSFVLPRGLLDRHAQRITATRFYLLRQMIFLVKLAAGMCWGRDPAVRAKMGMAPYPADPGTWLEGEPRRANRQLPVLRESAERAQESAP